MSIFEVLNKQQREIEELLGDTENAIRSDQRGLADVTFQLASMKLVACMRAEHSVVYPRFADAGLHDEVVQARAEHDAIEQAINNLRVGGLHGADWDAEVTRLARLVAQHAELEEYTLFPFAALTMGVSELERLGTEFVVYLACSTTVAGASITYEPVTPEPAHDLIIRFKAA